MEEAVEDFEQQMKEAVNEDHLGKRKCQVTWKVHRIHWEKNRFIYDLMYVRKAITKELVRPWFVAVPLHAACTAVTLAGLQFEWLVKEKIADGALIAKWRKPGYEFLCSMLAIQKNGHNFGTTSHCRVPLKNRAAAQRVTPDVNTGCVSCASCALPLLLGSMCVIVPAAGEHTDYLEQVTADSGAQSGGTLLSKMKMTRLQRKSTGHNGSKMGLLLQSGAVQKRRKKMNSPMTCRHG